MSTRTAPIHAAREKRGVVLVLFVLLAIGFMAIAGIAIDLGLARTAQRQMQSAADSVAIETLRERDRARIDPAATDPFLRDLMRRSLNSRYATWRYTDGLVVGNENETEPMGAGGYILLTEGQGSLNWGRSVAEIGWSAPRLAPNYETEEGQPGGPVTAIPRNEAHGDMVSGAFDAVIANPQGNPFRMEVPTYDRFDFTPAEADQAPYASSMLVRLRRTAHDFAGGSGGLDDELNISTNGPTIPMLFSAGTAIQGGDPDTNDSIRHTGFRVRATSIATARRAVRAGIAVSEAVLDTMFPPPLPPPGDPGHPRERELLSIGATSIALNAVLWNNTTSTDLWQPLATGGAEIRLEIWSEVNLAPNVLSVYDPDNPNSPWGEFPLGCLQWIEARSVGDRLPFFPPSDAALRDPSYWETREGLVPVYADIANMRVIGFGRVRAEIALDAQGDPETSDNGNSIMLLTRLPNEMALDPDDLWIAPRNASSRFDGTQTNNLTEAQWNAVMQRWSTLRHAVHAPALAR